jgi:RNA polymerase sigma factor (sigma-70 family)
MQHKEQEQAYNYIVEQHKGILYKVANTYCHNDADRQDLIQEMLIQIWHSIGKYNDQYKITTWLYRIALNVAISYYRKHNTAIHKSQPITANMDVADINNTIILEKEAQLSKLEQFINELKELDKALILLYLDDKSHAEIADILGLTVGNVGTKVGRIKDILKQRFYNTKN